MDCNTQYWTGAGDCKRLLGRVIGIGIVKKGTSFTVASFINETAWNVKIAAVATASRNAMVFPLINYERTTGDPEMQTSNLGIVDKTNDAAPAMDVWLRMGALDYLNLHDKEGSAFEFVLFLDDGTQVGTKKSDGTPRGFRGRFFTRKDLPASDNAQSSYPLNISFDSSNEFKNAHYASPDYDFTDLVDMVPVGMDMTIVTDYVVGTKVLVVKVVKRGTDEGVTGLIAADFEVLASDAVPTVAVTALTEDGQGQYSLTLEENTAVSAAALTAGDYFKIQASDEDATPTYLTYLSNVVKGIA